MQYANVGPFLDTLAQGKRASGWKVHAYLALFGAAEVFPLSVSSLKDELGPQSELEVLLFVLLAAITFRSQSALRVQK